MNYLLAENGLGSGDVTMEFNPRLQRLLLY